MPFYWPNTENFFVSFSGSFPKSDLSLEGNIGASSYTSAFCSRDFSLLDVYFVEVFGSSVFSLVTHYLTILGLLSYWATICLLAIITCCLAIILISSFSLYTVVCVLITFSSGIFGGSGVLPLTYPCPEIKKRSMFWFYTFNNLSVVSRSRGREGSCWMVLLRFWKGDCYLRGVMGSELPAVLRPINTLFLSLFWMA